MQETQMLLPQNALQKWHYNNDCGWVA